MSWDANFGPTNMTSEVLVGGFNSCEKILVKLDHNYIVSMIKNRRPRKHRVVGPLPNHLFMAYKYG